MLNRIKQLFSKPINYGTGAKIDDRPLEEKDKDYTLEEMVANVEPVDWIEKPESKWRKFPIYDQNGSGSCVAQTVAKLLGIKYFLDNDEYVHFSATHIYQRRKNKPSSGMHGVDSLDIAREGTTLEVLAPSQDMTDHQMDSFELPNYVDKVGSIFKTKNYIKFPNGDMDKVASTIQKTGKGVMVWFYFDRNEWTNVPEVKNSSLTVATGLRHSVTAVDFTLYKGQKALIIEDSWGIGHGFKGQRVITEDFFRVRNFFSAYIIDFKYDIEEEIDKVDRQDFNVDLHFGQTNDDVVNLQTALKQLKFFPSNIDTTGYYGAITAKAVLQWQVANQVAPLEELQSLQGRVFGPKSRAFMNEQLYQKSK